MNVIKLLRICENVEEMVKMLRKWNLIPGEEDYFCECGGIYSLMKDSERRDGLKWKCKNMVGRCKTKKVMCNKRVEFRTGTFFAKSNLSIFQILAFVDLWVDNATLKLIARQLDIDKNTAVSWSSFCREVVFDAFVINKKKLGGEGMVVEIDESKFGKRKYHRGHYVEGQWVFGGLERGTGRIFMVAVEARGADTLVPIINEWIEPNTTIISDFWKAYDCLDREGYRHLKVNHSINFKDPDTGAHTNAIESSGRHAKTITSSYGRKKAHIPGNLARYMFYKRCAELKLSRTEEFFRLAGQLYDARKRIANTNNMEELPEEDMDEFDE